MLFKRRSQKPRALHELGLEDIEIMTAWNGYRSRCRDYGKKPLWADFCGMVAEAGIF